MTVKQIYIADDGTEFEGICAQKRCIAYEKEKTEKQLASLSSYIKFFGWDGRPLAYHSIIKNTDRIYYIQVLAIPDEKTEPEIYSLWCKIVPWKLDEEISSCGWYAADCECFRAWDKVVKSYNEQTKMIAKLRDGN